MAAVTNSNTQVHGFTTPAGPAPAVTSSTVILMGCYLVTEFTGTYAAADNATIAAKTAIENARRNGKTVTIRDAALSSAAVETLAGVDANLGAKTIATDGTAITLELTQNDLSTERADGAMGTFKAPLGLFVCFSEA